MNRRGFLGAFLALPIAARLAKYAKPTPVAVAGFDWSQSTVLVSCDGSGAFATLVGALDAMPAGWSGVVYLKAGHTETMTEPLRIPPRSNLHIQGMGVPRPAFTWNRQ